jgi:hypothetical protein
MESRLWSATRRRAVATIEKALDELPTPLIQRALVIVTDLDFHERQDDRVRIIANEILTAETAARNERDWLWKETIDGKRDCMSDHLVKIVADCKAAAHAEGRREVFEAAVSLQLDESRAEGFRRQADSWEEPGYDAAWDDYKAAIRALAEGGGGGEKGEQLLDTGRK